MMLLRYASGGANPNSEDLRATLAYDACSNINPVILDPPGSGISHYLVLLTEPLRHTAGSANSSSEDIQAMLAYDACGSTLT